MASGVPEATIRKWASRGKLTRYGSARKAEYDIEELTALMAGKIPSVGGARRGGSPSGAADPTAL
jgi:hypothetical protein